jgi:hypothetical protein
VRWLDPEPEPAAGRKHRVRQGVRRAAEDAGCDAETVERLVLEAGERLDDDDIHGLMTRPFDEIVALIRQELGLAADAGMAPAPFPLDGGRAGDGGDLAAAPQLNRHPNSRPRPHQGGEEMGSRPP